jgi:hypothetical protein
MEKYRERLSQCIDNEGRHLSCVAFKVWNCITYTIQDLEQKYFILHGLVFISFPNRGALSVAPCRTLNYFNVFIHNINLCREGTSSALGIFERNHSDIWIRTSYSIYLYAFLPSHIYLLTAAIQVHTVFWSWSGSLCLALLVRHQPWSQQVFFVVNGWEYCKATQDALCTGLLELSFSRPSSQTIQFLRGSLIWMQILWNPKLCLPC